MGAGAGAFAVTGADVDVAGNIVKRGKGQEKAETGSVRMIKIDLGLRKKKTPKTGAKVYI